MDIDTQACVVGEVVSEVVGIVIDHDIVGIPKPAIAEGQVGFGNGKIETAEPEARRAAADKPEHVFGAETTGETAVLPGVIQMEAGIISAGIVPDPLIAVHMGSIRVAGYMIEVTVRRGGRGRATHRRRTMGGRTAGSKPMGASLVPPSLLREGSGGDSQNQNRRNSEFHISQSYLKAVTGEQRG